MSVYKGLCILNFNKRILIRGTITITVFSPIASSYKLLNTLSIYNLINSRLKISDHIGISEIVQFNYGDPTLLVKTESFSDKLASFYIKKAEDLEIEIIKS